MHEQGLARRVVQASKRLSTASQEPGPSKYRHPYRLYKGHPVYAPGHILELLEARLLARRPWNMLVVGHVSPVLPPRQRRDIISLLGADRKSMSLSLGETTLISRNRKRYTGTDCKRPLNSSCNIVFNFRKGKRLAPAARGKKKRILATTHRGRLEWLSSSLPQTRVALPCRIFWGRWQTTRGPQGGAQ